MLDLPNQYIFLKEGPCLSRLLGACFIPFIFFQGYIQNLFVVPGPNGHRLQCPSTKDLACPTCGEFRGLQDVVQSMQDQYLKQIQLLEQRLQATEDRLSKVEECDCHKSCRLPGGLIREDGASWSDQCQLCSCVVST